MSSSGIWEEDQHPDYAFKRYYPARIGETISGRYRIMSKLGWGANSTVWLAKDTSRWFWNSPQYVTLKITNCGKGAQTSAMEEVQISQHISQVKSQHRGRPYIRLVEESFAIQGPFGEHLCLVFEPLREPLWLLGKHLGSNGVPPAVLKPFLRILLQGLDFLHSECHIIHTDLKSDNLLVGFEDLGVLKDYVRQQESDPAPFKEVDGQAVFQSRPEFGHFRKGTGLMRISDFSAAVFGNVPVAHSHEVQPQPFCAPEVLLGATWTYSADIWNFGTMLWELLADDVLFDGLDPRSHTYSKAAHIAQMIRLIGPPSRALLNRTKKEVSGQFFTTRGEFKFPELIPLEEYNFPSLTPFLHGEDQKLFIEFARKVLRWEPEERPSAGELYNDPWLTSKF